MDLPGKARFIIGGLRMVRFVLEFDEPPKLIFVSEKGHPRKGDALYIDGKRVNGIKAVRIYSRVDEVTTHEVDFVTAMAGERREDKNATD